MCIRLLLICCFAKLGFVSVKGFTVKGGNSIHWRRKQFKTNGTLRLKEGISNGHFHFRSNSCLSFLKLSIPI